MYQSNINNRTLKIWNLLNEASDSKFVTQKWNLVNDQSNRNYDEENEIIYNTGLSKSSLCYYNDTCILTRGDHSTCCNSSSIQIMCTTY